MNFSSPRYAFSLGMRAATLLLVSGGSLIFLSHTALAQTRGITPPKQDTQLTAKELGMTDACFAQLQALMAEKAQRTPAQKKIDSQLIFLAKMASQKPIADGVNQLMLSAKTDIGGRVLVDIHAPVSEELLKVIVYNGGEIVDAQPNFDAIRAWVVINNVEWLAERKDVITIRGAVPSVTRAGSVTGQGDTTHASGGAAGARAIYNTDGTGVYVGVLSDSNTKKTQSAATGDIAPLTGAEPTTQDLSGQTGTASSAEGTAMLEIVHDIAPGASLRFGTADSSEAGFAQNILNLQSLAGCSVIVDDVGYFDEPPFMDGIVAKAVDQVTNNGALYFSAAGNEGNSNFGTTSGTTVNYSSVWEGDFSNGGTVPATAFDATYGSVHKYPNGALFNTARQASTITFFWSDPLGASANDYDVYATNTAGSSIVSGSNGTQSGTQDPYEAFNVSTNNKVYVFKYSGADRMIHLNGSDAFAGGYFTYVTDGQTHGHGQARNAFDVAAAPAQAAGGGGGFAGPYPGIFSASSPYEYFTSEGPRRVHYLNDGSPITTNNFSSTGGELRLKPDLTAADGVSSSAAFTSASGLNPFYGTSAAAPHAAAIAALVRSYKSANATAAANVPTGVTIDGSKFTTTEMRTILINGCIDLNTKGATTGWDKATGYGMLMPKNALAFITAFSDGNKIGIKTDATTATIAWNTALPADTIVEYGTKSGVYTSTVTGTSGTAHSVTITGLAPVNGYYFRVRSKTAATEAASGAVFVSPERSFATSGTANPGTASIIGTSATTTASPSPTITLTLKNAGTGAATNLKITSVTLNGTNTTTSLPTGAVTLAAGATTAQNLTFTGITAGSKLLVVKGSYDGAFFNFSIRVNVP